MLRFVVRRVLQAIPMLFFICVICFILIQLAPYDAVDSITRPDMSPAVVTALRAKYGLDQPAWIQFAGWLQRMATGNLGYSIINHQSVADELAARLPNTLLLILPSYCISLALAIVLGLTAGSKRGGRGDRFISSLCSIGMATPVFWIAMIFIYVFAYRLDLLPVMGMYTLGGTRNLGDLLRHMVLPCTILVLAFLPATTRYVRSSTISQFSEDYVMVQRAFGARRWQVLFRHVLKNVLLPVITLIGMSLPMLVTGAFVTESIFSWPGVGTYFLEAIRSFDYPVIMVILLLSSTMVILGNLLADVCYGLVDPRIRSLG